MIYEPIPYASEQGIYLGLARVIRELNRLIRESLDLTGDFNTQVNELHLSGGDPQARRNLPELQRAS